MRKIVRKLDNKKIAVCSVILLLLSMLPIWYLAKYARPSGDDYGYSALTHAAWLDTHSIWAVFGAAVQTVKQNYMSWNGDWFTTFLFSLMPEVFAPWTFWIVPFIMTGALIGGTSVFLYEVCVKMIGMAKEDFLIFNSIVLIASFQYIPSTAIGMYWYVGAVHYILPHMAALFALVAAWRFFTTGKYRHLVAACIWNFAVGGSSYFSCLLLFLLYPVLIALGFRKNKKIVWLLAPFFICLTGFVIQCKSPGNVVRGGENFGLHANAAVSAVLESLWQGLVTIGIWFQEKTFVFVLLAILAVFGWGALLKRTSSFRFRYPLLFVILMYGCYSAQFAPAIYSAVEVSLGPATMEYLTFLLAAAASVFYIEGWMIGKIKERRNSIFTSEEKWRMYVIFPVIAVCMLLTVLNRGWIRNSVDARALEYVMSGRADDFKEQIAQQMEVLLDDRIKEAYLVPTSDDQGPLMHMPVTADENAFTNWAVREFYRKDKVVMITD